MKSTLFFMLTLVAYLSFLSASPASAAVIGDWASGFFHPSPGVDGQVRAFAIFDDGSGPALYATGGFPSGVGVLARWDGWEWTTVGGGITPGFGIDLAVFDDGLPDAPALYVAGDFSMVGEVPALNIARWNGKTVTALGEGLGHTTPYQNQGQVWSLMGFDDGSGPAIFAGGFFNVAGDVVSQGIARWDVCPPPRVGDLDGDGAVGQQDLDLLLNRWGRCPGTCPPSCSGDLDGDCAVGITDFLILLANWN